jgi:hypothetical protein
MTQATRVLNLNPFWLRQSKTEVCAICQHGLMMRCVDEM